MVLLNLLILSCEYLRSSTGGNIKGNKIDIFLNSDSECFIWGIKKVTLHIIAYPGEW